MTQTPADMAEALRAHPAIRSKLGIAQAAGMLGLTGNAPGCPGDDAAMIRTAEGFDLLAGEGCARATRCRPRPLWQSIWACPAP